MGQKAIAAWQCAEEQRIDGTRRGQVDEGGLAWFNVHWYILLIAAGICQWISPPNIVTRLQHLQSFCANLPGACSSLQAGSVACVALN